MMKYYSCSIQIALIFRDILIDNYRILIVCCIHKSVPRATRNNKHFFFLCFTNSGSTAEYVQQVSTSQNILLGCLLCGPSKTIQKSKTIFFRFCISPPESERKTVSHTYVHHHPRYPQSERSKIQNILRTASRPPPVSCELRITCYDTPGMSVIQQY